MVLWVCHWHFPTSYRKIAKTRKAWTNCSTQYANEMTTTASCHSVIKQKNVHCHRKLIA